MYLSTAIRSCTFRSSYSLKLAMIGADRYIQFSEPQLEHDKFPEDETPRVRLASQFAQNTMRLSRARLTGSCGTLPSFSQNFLVMCIVLISLSTPIVL